MKPRDKRDLQTVNVFVVLALLTILFVLGLRAVLFAPVDSRQSQLKSSVEQALEAEKLPK